MLILLESEGETYAVLTEQVLLQFLFPEFLEDLMQTKIDSSLTDFAFFAGFS